ncbi:MAG: TonB-dependent receptor [Verrucomicrobia bacterium]|nr:TonB-dependent receptor [Cytophagales bacterium]
MPLNDANAAFAPAYQLLGGKIGYKKDFKHLKVNVFAGIDNALDQFYSLGNDLNAVGNRFYNPAAGRNFFGGLTLGWQR